MSRSAQLPPGTWWRCAAHGMTNEPIWLSSFPYCPHEDCVDQVARVKGSIRDEKSLAATCWTKSSERDAEMTSRRRRRDVAL